MDEFNDYVYWGGYSDEDEQINKDCECFKIKREDLPCTCSGAQMLSGMWSDACEYHNYKD